METVGNAGGVGSDACLALDASGWLGIPYDRETHLVGDPKYAYWSAGDEHLIYGSLVVKE